MVNRLNEEFLCTAIPYRVSTGPEQRFPCVLFPNREKPVFISWDPCNEKRFFLLGKVHRENPVFITGMGLQCTWFLNELYLGQDRVVHILRQAVCGGV